MTENNCEACKGDDYDENAPWTPRRKISLDCEWGEEYDVSVFSDEARDPRLGKSHRSVKMGKNGSSFPGISEAHERAQLKGTEKPISSSSERLLTDNALCITEENFLIIVMVGLPAQGKSFTCRRIARWLCWKGIPAKIFSTSQIRRDLFGELYDEFRIGDAKQKRDRDRVALIAAECALKWIEGMPSGVAIIDSANVTSERREAIMNVFHDYPKECIVFIECVTESLFEQRQNLLRNVDLETYSTNELDDIANELERRTKEYKKIYQPLDPRSDSELSFMRLIEPPRHIQLQHISRNLPIKLVSFLTSLFPREGNLYLSSCGQSKNILENRLGGDSQLTPLGLCFSLSLRWLFDRIAVPSLNILTSSRTAAVETAIWMQAPDKKVPLAVPNFHEILPDSHLKSLSQNIEVRNDNKAHVDSYCVRHMSALDDINHGDWENLTLHEVDTTIPSPLLARKNPLEKYDIAWIGGESYHDLVARLEKAILHIHRSESPVLVIAHPAVIQVLYAFRAGLPPERSPEIEIDTHVVYQFGYHPRHGMRVRTLDMRPVVSSMLNIQVDWSMK